MVNSFLTKTLALCGLAAPQSVSRVRAAARVLLATAFVSSIVAVSSASFTDAAAQTGTKKPDSKKAQLVSGEVLDGALTVRFAWSKKVEYSVVRAEKLVIVRFSRPLDADIAPIAASGADFFAEVRKGGNNRLVIFRLKKEMPITDKAVGNAVEVQFGKRKPTKPVPPSLVNLRLVKGDGYQRLAFAWPGKVAYRFAPESRRATLLFDKPGRLRTAAARAALDNLGISVSGRRVAERLMVTLEFKSDVRLRASSEGSDVYVDVFPAATGGDGGGAAVRARLDVNNDGAATDVTVDWPAPVSAAVFRYGGFTWLVFGSPARFDLSNVKRKLGPGIEDIEQILLDNATILRLRTARDMAPKVSREGWQWRIRLAKGKARARTSVYVRADPAAANGGRVMMRTGSAGSVISVTDPAVGTLLFIIPVSAPGLGMKLPREYVKFRLLATVQGLVVVPNADDLSVAVSGAEVEVTNPGGLALSGAN